MTKEEKKEKCFIISKAENNEKLNDDQKWLMHYERLWLNEGFKDESDREKIMELYPKRLKPILEEYADGGSYEGCDELFAYIWRSAWKCVGTEEMAKMIFRCYYIWDW